MRKVQAETKKDVFVVGGCRVASSFLSEGLFDEVRLFITPTLLGQGVSLFSLGKMVDLTLTGCTAYKSGLVELRYTLLNSTKASR